MERYTKQYLYLLRANGFPSFLSHLLAMQLMTINLPVQP